MRTVDRLLPGVRATGFDVVSLLDLPAIEEASGVSGERVRVELLHTVTGKRFVVVVSESDRSTVYGSGKREGEVLRRVLARAADDARGASVEGVADTYVSVSEALPNAEYAPLVAARVALPRSVAEAAVAATLSSHRPRDGFTSTRSMDAYVLAAHALSLDGNPSRELLERSLALLSDLASGAPVEWVLHRHWSAASP